MKTTFCSKGCALLFVIVLGLPALAWAQDKKPLPDRFHAELGAFIVTNVNTTVELAASAGPITAGTRIDFEDDLGIDDSDTVPRLDGYFRFGKRSRIDFTWWKIDREGTATTPFDIDFGDISIPAGTVVNSFFDEEVINLSYGFSFYNVPKAEMGLKAGLFIAKIGTGIEVVGGALSESETLTAPLPVLGAYFRYDMGKRWRFRGDAQVFFLELDEFEGSLSDLRLSVEHQTFRHLGFGFGFNRIGTAMEVDDGDFRGEFTNTLTGFRMYLFGAFGTAKYQR